MGYELCMYICLREIKTLAAIVKSPMGGNRGVLYVCLFMVLLRGKFYLRGSKISDNKFKNDKNLSVCITTIIISLSNNHLECNEFVILFG